MARKAKKSVAEASNEMFTLLEGFNADERARIVSGTLTLLGDPVSAQVSTQAGGTGGAAAGARSAARLPVFSATAGSARSFLDGKAPKVRIPAIVDSDSRPSWTGPGVGGDRRRFFSAVHYEFRGRRFCSRRRPCISLPQFWIWQGTVERE